MFSKRRVKYQFSKFIGSQAYAWQIWGLSVCICKATFHLLCIHAVIAIPCIFYSTGIDISTWTVAAEDEHITYSVWDFAGQTVYYNTHQVILNTNLQCMGLCWSNCLLQHTSGNTEVCGTLLVKLSITTYIR